jgi:hypothetical protein
VGKVNLVDSSKFKLPHTIYVPGLSLVKVPIPSHDMLKQHPSLDSPPIVWKYEQNTKIIWRLDVSKQIMTCHNWEEMSHNFRAASWVNISDSRMLMCGGIHTSTTS